MENKDWDISQPFWIISSCWLTGQLFKKRDLPQHGAEKKANLAQVQSSRRANVHMHYYSHTTHTVNFRWKETCSFSTSVLSTCWLSLFGFYPPHSSSFSLSLSLSLIPNLTPKMQAVYLRRAEAIPLSSPTRCFIPKRDLFSKINGESKGLPKWYLPWHEVIATKSKLSK